MVGKLNVVRGEQPRQHEADQHDGVLKSVETHLGDLPLPLPTNRRLPWLAKFSSLQLVCQPREALNIFWAIVFIQSNNTYNSQGKINTMPLRSIYFTVFSEVIQVWR